MEIPQIKVSQGLLLGLAISGAILAIVLFYENQKMRRDLMLFAEGKSIKKPCGCEDAETIAHASARLNSQPMPEQSHNDPEHPPEVVL